MYEFDIPANLNGGQLENELGLPFGSVYVRENKLVIVAPELTEKTVADKVKAHKGINTAPTISEKLEAAGIDLDELRVALGL